jgi:D-alanine transaminase
MEKVYLNGKHVNREDASVSPDDRGFLFADGVYEVVRWYGSFFLGMEEHHRRLIRSLREMEIDWPEVEHFPELCHSLLEVNGLSENQALVYFQITRGAARRTHQYPNPPVAPTSYAFASAFNPDKEARLKGVAISTAPDIRWARCDIKSVSLLGNTMSFQKAREKGMYECIFIRNGVITEASHSNVFFIKGSNLITHPPSNHILSGITRGIILELARKEGIRIIEDAVHAEELLQMDEVFLTSTSSEVTPVISIDGNQLGSGTPGEMTRRLIALTEDKLAAIIATIKNANRIK